MKEKIWTTADIASQIGKVAVITGANSGLGLEAAKVLGQKGATVIMAVRDIEKGKYAVLKILDLNPAAKLELMQLDLSDLGSIQKFSNEFQSKYNRIDILMNNAGVMWPVKKEITKQGFEMQIGVNHLGHFALTGQLLGIIKKTPNSRVVTQSSIAHKMNADINFNDFNWDKTYSKTKAYAQSKLANLLFTYELDSLFKEHKINALANVAHPGITSTNLFRSAGVVNSLVSLLAQKVDMGTLPMLRAATEEGLNGGEFFGQQIWEGLLAIPNL